MVRTLSFPLNPRLLEHHPRLLRLDLILRESMVISIQLVRRIEVVLCVSFGLYRCILNISVCLLLSLYYASIIR